MGLRGFELVVVFFFFFLKFAIFKIFFGGGTQVSKVITKYESNECSWPASLFICTACNDS